MGLAYHIWIVSLQLIEPAHLTIPLRVDRVGQSQLYFDRGDGLREQDSSVRTVAARDDLVDVQFPVPRTCLTKLRFDPLNAAGTFSLGEPRFEDSSGKVVAKIALEEISALHEIAELKKDRGKLVGSTIAGATDPQLELKLQAPVCISSIRLPWVEALVVAGLLAVIRRCNGSNRGHPEVTTSGTSGSDPATSTR